MDALLKFKCTNCGMPTKYNNGKCDACYKKQNAKVSEGEKFLAQFFDIIGIRYHEQVEIKNLIGDTKGYRIADFYLPQYNVYLEFNGHYRDHREQYDEKIQVYRRNKIPCIYIYPENLGIISYVFDQRLQQELINHNYHHELKLYRFKKFKVEGIERILFCSLALFVMIFELLTNYFPQQHEGVLGFSGIIAVYQFYLIHNLWKAIYKENRYYME